MHAHMYDIRCCCDMVDMLVMIACVLLTDQKFFLLVMGTAGGRRHTQYTFT